MNPDNRTNNILKNQNGMAAIIVALGIVALLGMAALAIDIGYLSVNKNELQNISDSAALAGAGELSRQYLDPSFDNVDNSLIVAIAENVANSNASGFTIQVQIGTWRDRDEGFIGTLNNRPNAVKVIARRGSDGNSQVPTFFARIWDIDGLDAMADAVAALTGASTIAEGELEIPVGISQQWFEENFCDQNIQFYPTAGTDGCAGWHVYDTWPANANDLNDILAGMISGDFTPPAFDLDDDPSFAFTGGNLSSLLDNLSALFALHQPVWETEVVVYGEDCGVNPNQTIPIVGFASVEITGVIGPPPVLIATAKCGKITPGTGGGNYYGTWGSIPGLVE
jgi:putative Flp pilus-assembly TadE/G-like protein